MSINVLIVEDHKLIVEMYILLLDELPYNINYIKAFNADEALKVIYQNQKLDLILLDINIPSSSCKKISNGLDLGILIRKKFNSKIIFLTMHTSGLWINRIFNTLKPEGFFSKSELDTDNFATLINNVLKGELVYTTAILKEIKCLLKHNLQLDHIDSQIIQCLYNGIKTSKLINYIPLSLSAIEKRKSNLKKQFMFNPGSDSDFLKRIDELNLIDQFLKE